jgi:hypothetical protein
MGLVMKQGLFVFKYVSKHMYFSLYTVSEPNLTLTRSKKLTVAWNQVLAKNRKARKIFCGSPGQVSHKIYNLQVH